MAIFEKPCVKIQQGEKVLLITSFTVGDFMTTGPDFYSINRLDPDSENDSEMGFQRLLQKERAKRLAKYAIEAKKSGNHAAFLPTSVFLATEQNIDFDETQNKIRFDHADVCPFDVVDGQHRIKGLLSAAEEMEDIKDYPIAVNIAINSSSIEKMLHFYIVNMTQKAVDPAVGERIRARFFKMLKTEKMPFIPSWIKNKIESGVDYDAISYVDFLNSDPQSPWCGKIQLSNKERESFHTITQKSFITSLKKSILREEHPLLLADNDPDMRKKILAKYWSAVTDIFTSSEYKETVVFKSIGALFFNRLSSAVINIANSRQSYKKEDFVGIFRAAENNLSDELLPLMTPGWWASGGGASDMNSGAVDKKSAEFRHAITQSARSQNNS